jgi:hypothetical protein
MAKYLKEWVSHRLFLWKTREFSLNTNIHLDIIKMNKREIRQVFESSLHYALPIHEKYYRVFEPSPRLVVPNFSGSRQDQ